MNNQSAINYYIGLQRSRFTRLLKDNGIYLWLFIPISIVLFAFLTIRLLDDFAYGELIYAMLGISLVFPFTENRRLEFLKQISNNRNFYLIRLIEQFTMLTPFIVGLLIYNWFVVAAVLIALGCFFGFSKLNYTLPFSVPTPFGKRPFEFPAGFRKTLPIIILAYALASIGLSVNNFNLALASMAAVGFVVGSFYTSAESRFYVWIFKFSPKWFLKKKSLAIVTYLTLLIIPIIITLLIFDSSQIWKIAVMYIAVIGFAIMCMLSKYISYPQEINLIQGMAMGASILFPPIMLVIIPWFYFKALSGLQPILR